MRRTLSLVAIILIALASSPALVAEPIVRVLALFPGKAMLSIDGKRQVLARGERTPEGIELLDADTDRAVVRIGKERLTLRPGGVVSARFEKPHKREVRILRNDNGAYQWFDQRPRCRSVGRYGCEQRCSE